jgi:hypothetical protein
MARDSLVRTRDGKRVVNGTQKTGFELTEGHEILDSGRFAIVAERLVQSLQKEASNFSGFCQIVKQDHLLGSGRVDCWRLKENRVLR